MATYTSFLLFSIVSLLLFTTPTLSKKSVYIVHMLEAHKPVTFSSAHDWYSSILHTISAAANTTGEAIPDHLYTYSHAATGFAAHITEAHAAALREHPSVVSVVPDRRVVGGTTQSPRFMGLSDEQGGLWPESNFGNDIIIGVLDTGIWPESVAFHDLGLGSVPARWKGVCEEGPDFPSSLCNNKIIGARAFYKGFRPVGETLSARDNTGHGTHCASTAGGSAVNNAGFLHYAVGQARGVAPRARIAAYKFLWGPGAGEGSTSDALAAMDQAIEDGVDVLSFSFYHPFSIFDYKDDVIAIGSFRAVEKGIFVSAIAGNQGPWLSLVNNVAPWMLTVGASTIDREFVAELTLGNGQIIRGASLSLVSPNSTTFSMELVDGWPCFLDHFTEGQLAGKMAVCSGGSGAENSVIVQGAGATGIISFEEDMKAQPFVIPGISVPSKAWSPIFEYIWSTSKPTATITFRGTVIGPSPSSPRIASISSRGPNSLTREILKPDVIAPGVNILAAWTGAIGPSSAPSDPRRVPYNIVSGTSMAGPHASGLAALLKSARPSWSPSAIKSAIITTANHLDNSGANIMNFDGTPSTSFDYGSGHITPNKSSDPGLVYDMDTSDYVAFLCSIGYSETTISLFVRGSTKIDCSTSKLSSPGDLNYPSFSVLFTSPNDEVTYTRVVKNVGSSRNVVYRVHVNAPENVGVRVSPTILVFRANVQTLSYNITFTSVGVPDEDNPISSGSIVWSDGMHQVRSPIGVNWRLIYGDKKESMASI